MKTKYILLLFFLLGVTTRFPLIEETQSHWDGPQYSIGVASFNLSQETPAPPGYPVYIFMGWLVNHFMQDPHFSLLLVGVLFSGLTAASFFLAGKYIFSKEVGVISALLYLSSPVYFFFGLTAYPYGLISFFVLIVAVVVYKIVFERKQYELILGFMFGLFCGIRPQDTLNLLPLALFGLFALSKKGKIKAIFCFVLSILAWLAPLMIVAGGTVNYFFQLSTFLKQGAFDSLTSISTGENIRRSAKGLFLSLGIASFTLIYFPPRFVSAFQSKNYRKRVFYFTLWIVPGLLSVLFIRNDHSGYQMVYMTALLLLAAFSLEKFTKRFRFPYLIVAFVVVFNLLWFFRDRDPDFQYAYVPTSFHYSEIRKNDNEMIEKIRYISRNFKPDETVVVVGSQHFRPVMYHLKDYKVVSLSALETNDPKYGCCIRSGRYWKKEEYKIDTSRVTFDAGAKRLVFFEDEAGKVLELEKEITHNLQYNSQVTELPLQSRDVFQIKYKMFAKSDD